MDKLKSTLSQLRQLRIDKSKKLRDMGINPYPSKSSRTNRINEILNDFEGFEEKNVTLSGRLMSWREHGQLLFGHIQDPTGKIQLYIKQSDLQSTNSKEGNIGWEDLNLFDVGDIVEAEGTITKTKRGEISILTTKLKILTKAIRPLPDKWEGLQDKEKLFRQRYLDTTMNPERKEKFEKLAKITFAIREFLYGKGFLEIKTPIIQPVYGGTSAKPFKTHVNALGCDYFMAVSHELYLKRLITGGFENVFNIVGYFRNEGIDRTHNPEFSMVETMTAYQNYEFNMNLIEEMYKYVSEKVFGRTKFMIRDHEIDFGKPWRRIMMKDAVKEFAGYDFEKVISLEEAHSILKEINYHKQFPNSIGECMVAVFEEKVEEQLIDPTFVYGHPVEISPLAKQMDSNPRYVERFEIFIGGIEGGDNWSELNDPIELYKRFKDQVERGRGGDDEHHPMDIEFVEMMEYGMPPTTGLGPGIERLAMMMCETEYIDDVIYFPMQKPAPISDLQKEIYDEKYIDPEFQKTKNQEGIKQDKTKKMVIVLQKGLEGWRLTNTIGHLTAYLGSQIGKDDIVSTPAFRSLDGKELNSNSQYPVISLTANPGQMYNLLEKVEELKLVHLAYVDEMITFSDDIELAKALKNKNKQDMNYLGIGIFGPNDVLDAITKKFSLFK